MFQLWPAWQGGGKISKIVTDRHFIPLPLPLYIYHHAGEDDDEKP